MQKKYSVTSIVLIVFIVSCSFTTVDQGQNGFENQEDISSEAALSQPKDEISGTLVIYSGSCLLYTSPSPRDRQKSRMPSSA